MENVGHLSPNFCIQVFIGKISWWDISVSDTSDESDTSDISHSSLGMDPATKSDEFSEKFQTAFDPPLIFRKLYCNFLW